jgi:hypothetical protein
MPQDTGPQAKQWAFAATAIPNSLMQRAPRHDRLGGADKTPDTEASARAMLKSAWGVEGLDALVQRFEWLHAVGHNDDYQKAAAAYAQNPGQQDPRLAFVAQHGAEIGNRGLVAWDLGRLLAVAGLGYLAGYCNEEQAWGAILMTCEKLRATYSSWDEYGKHYRLGAMFGDPNAVGSIDAVLAQLSSAPDSPWRVVQWQLGAGAPAQPGFGAPPAAQPGFGAPPAAQPGFGAPPAAQPGFGAPPAAQPGFGAPPAAPGGFPAPAAAPGGFGAPPAPGSPGAPQAYGGVPVIAPPPPGSPGAPQAYGGVPVIAPTPGGMPPQGGMMPFPGGVPGVPGVPGVVAKGKKTLLFVLLGVGGLVVVVVLALVIHHFMHHGSEEPAHETPHGHHGKR